MEPEKYRTMEMLYWIFSHTEFSLSSRKIESVTTRSLLLGKLPQNKDTCVCFPDKEIEHFQNSEWWAAGPNFAIKEEKEIKVEHMLKEGSKIPILYIGVILYVENSKLFTNKTI